MSDRAEARSRPDRGACACSRTASAWATFTRVARRQSRAAHRDNTVGIGRRAMLAFGKRLGIALVVGVACGSAAHAQATPKQPAPGPTTKPVATKPAASGRAAPVSGDQVLRHLHLTIAWYRRLSTLSQSPALADNEIAHDRLQRTSLAAVQYAFDFATAAARLVDASHSPADTTAIDSYDDAARLQDRKSTRLNSSHPSISYAVFCLKKKNRHQS